jgi:DNA-binding beta-propeller fold protein YncE
MKWLVYLLSCTPAAALGVCLTAVGEWGSYGSAPGAFNGPADVAVRADGSVAVADRYNGRIQYFDAAGAYLGAWGQGILTEPLAVAAAPGGGLYVLDRALDAVIRFDAAGTPASRWGGRGGAPGEFRDAGGLAVAPDASVLVADAGNGRVQRFGPDGDWLGATDAEGNHTASPLSYPADIALGPEGAVYVADAGADRIVYYTPEGDYGGGWGGYGQGPGEMFWETGVAVSPEGFVVVADTGNGRLLVFDAAGVPIAAADSAFGKKLKRPRGVAAGATGCIYVADEGNDRVVIFRLDAGD